MCPNHDFLALHLFSRPCRNVSGAVGEARHRRWQRRRTLGRKLKQQEVPGTWAPYSAFGWSLSPSHNATSSQSGCCSLPPKPALPASPPPGGVPRAHVTPLAIGSPWSARGFVLDSPFLSRTPGIFSCCQLCFKSAIMG